MDEIILKRFELCVSKLENFYSLKLEKSYFSLIFRPFLIIMILRSHKAFSLLNFQKMTSDLNSSTENLVIYNF